MKLKTRGRKAATRYVTDNDTPLESQDAQAAATYLLIQDILGRLFKIETISILLGQDYDGSGSEGPRRTPPELLSLVVILEETADSAACEADTSQSSTNFPIEETASFELLLNISGDEEVLPEATKPLQGPATQPNSWRTRPKKKKRCWRPPTAFEAAVSKIEPLFDTCAPPSEALAKLQSRENCPGAMMNHLVWPPPVICLFSCIKSPPRHRATPENLQRDSSK